MTSFFPVQRCEFAKPQPYDGRGEVTFAIAASLLWFGAIVVRLHLSGKPWTLTEQILEAACFVWQGGLTLFLASHPGTRLAQRILLKRHGLGFQLFTCLGLFLYIVSVRWLGSNFERFAWIVKLDKLIWPGQFWFNLAVFLAGVFVALRIPFFLLDLRQQTIQLNHLRGVRDAIQRFPQLLVLLILNYGYLILTNTFLSPLSETDITGYWLGASYFILLVLMSLPIARKTSSQRLMLFDFFLSAACVLSLFWFSKPYFNVGTFITINLFVLVVIHGTQLGREHFGYSFQLRWSDVRYWVGMVAIAMLILIPTAFALRFVNPQWPDVRDARALLTYLVTVLSYSILFSFRVGIFEEILFRCGLMTLVRDQLVAGRATLWSAAKLVVVSALCVSVLFGIAHIGNEPRSSLGLAPTEYKIIYAVLATTASMLYSLAFGETNRLWCSITIHGIVDTVAVVILGASLTVPF